MMTADHVEALIERLRTERHQVNQLIECGPEGSLTTDQTPEQLARHYDVLTHQILTLETVLGHETEYLSDRPMPDSI